jgi:hypothetical protein
VLVESTEALQVPPGGEAGLALDHTFPADTDLGIYHVDYELLDAAGEPIQALTEAPSGRIVLAQAPTNPSRPTNVSGDVVVLNGEYVLFGDAMTFRYRLVNRSEDQKRLRIYKNQSHAPLEFVEEILLDPGAVHERDLIGGPEASTKSNRINLRVFDADKPTWPWYPGPSGAGGFIFAAHKQYRAIYPRVSITPSLDQQYYRPEQEGTLTLQLRNRTEWSLPVPNATVRVWKRDLYNRQELLLEMPLSLPGDGEETVTVRFSTGPRNSFYALEAQVDVVTPFASRMAGNEWVPVLTVEPQLWAPSLTTPTWSRTSTNPVTWELQNSAPVALEAGFVRATLKADGTDVWSEERPLVLPAAPDGRVSFAFDVPPIADATEVVLDAHNGFAQTLVVHQPVQGILVARVEPLGQEYASWSTNPCRASSSPGWSPWARSTALASRGSCGSICTTRAQSSRRARPRARLTASGT